MRFRRAEETHKPFNGHTGKMLVNVRGSSDCSSNSTSKRRQADALPAGGGDAQAVQPSQTLNPKNPHTSKMLVRVRSSF